MSESKIDNVIWPKHKGSLYISHNDHKSNYENIEDAIGIESECIHCTYDVGEFPDEEEIDKAIEMDSVWTIQWYPDTPIGSYRVCAATLGRALEEANKVR